MGICCSTTQETPVEVQTDLGTRYATPQGTPRPPTPPVQSTSTLRRLSFEFCKGEGPETARGVSKSSPTLVNSSSSASICSPRPLSARCTDVEILEATHFPRKMMPRESRAEDSRECALSYDGRSGDIVSNMWMEIEINDDEVLVHCFQESSNRRKRHIQFYKDVPCLRLHELCSVSVASMSLSLNIPLTAFTRKLSLVTRDHGCLTVRSCSSDQQYVTVMASGASRVDMGHAVVGYLVLFADEDSLVHNATATHTLTAMDGCDARLVDIRASKYASRIEPETLQRRLSVPTLVNRAQSPSLVSEYKHERDLDSDLCEPEGQYF